MIFFQGNVLKMFIFVNLQVFFNASRNVCEFLLWVKLVKSVVENKIITLNTSADTTSQTAALCILSWHKDIFIFVERKI